MNEDPIKAAMAKAAQAEPSAGDAYARFVAARRRAARLRNLSVAVGAVAAMATIFMVLPGTPWRQGNPSDFAPGGRIDPTKSVVHRYEDATVGFELLYPAEWKAAGSPGNVVRFYPPETKAPRPGAVFDLEVRDAECLETCVPSEPPLRTEKPRGFFVEVRPIAGPCPRAGDWPCFDPARPDPDYVDELTDGGARANVDSAQIGTRPAFRLGAAFESKPRRFTTVPSWRKNASGTDRVIPRYWCSRCLLTEYVVDWFGRWTLDVRIVAANEDQLQTHGVDASALLQSIIRFRAPK